MENASNIAASQLLAKPIRTIDAIDKTIEKPKTSCGAIFPEEIGLFCVRVISASISRSYHILKAAAEPEPSAMLRMTTNTKNECVMCGARTVPTRPV